MEDEDEKDEPKIELKNYRTDSLIKKKVKIEDNNNEIINRSNKSGTMVKKKNFKISDSIKLRANLF